VALTLKNAGLCVFSKEKRKNVFKLKGGTSD
jgi:hypothetical protein